MKFTSILTAGAMLLAGLALVAAEPALARAKKKVQPACATQPQTFSWTGIFTNPTPQPNGCAPPVYAYGKYIGQDPDPNIRFQLQRDPDSGYQPFH
jgi:hypothetical protein